ncbi:hypothetical protein [Haloarcula pellucida]|uniref:Major capsid protein n=1 Tax=Haloarcula pellucida TaxID=1427151 RepID=A0A830GUV6_9EURY|nr:hypothetical protein [Halomicroarcula pellucida]MBX0350482.1 hypothetical protein [Halomicroarcula pellucida]GGO03531.1 hypothetical protein GCM10009030_39280 [Halomicroarcula pellucida]
MHAHTQHLYNQQYTPGGAARGMWSNLFDQLEQQATFGADTTGLANDIAGLVLYNQVNMKNNILGAIPEVDRTGEEQISPGDTPAKTFRSIFNPPSISGVSGGGSVPTAVTADVRKVAADVRISSMAIESDLIVDIESRLGHDTVGLDELTEIMRDYMTRSVERDALARTVNASGGTAGDTPQYSNDDLLLTIDRAIASEDEETNGVDANGDAFSDGDLDVYDIDRSATGAGGDNEANWADAYVDHNSGTLRQLTSDRINTFIDNYVQNGSAERGNFFLVTGYNTARVMSDLRESQFRADALRQATREDVNDAESRLGANFNAQISHWDGHPIIVAETVPSDSLERIYAMDPSLAQTGEDGDEPKPKISLENYRAPDVWRAGADAPVNPLATGEFKNEALFAMYHELVVRDFSAMGKLRDVEA